jgi:hypothetical protein
MLKITEFAGNQRPPSCGHCGGSGYVYLWGISALGSHVWFCDRNICKRFWSDAGRALPTLATGPLAGHELQPDVARTEERVLQPV